jgi:hypothetical protein
MPRAKPSAWQPKGLEVFDTSDLYSDDYLTKLITHHLGTHSEKKTRKILVQLRNITGLLRAGLYYRKRPTCGLGLRLYCGLWSGDDGGVDGHILCATVYWMASGIGFIGSLGSYEP